MDVTNWKRILLKWIGQLGFLERQFYNLEQSDIESFFNKFRERMKNAVISEEITIFLKDEYPDFEPNLDDENALSSADYMYVYSLMLHFSCVKCPEEYFHKVCQNLPEQYQLAIAGFFKRVLEKDILTKSTLRHAIATITYVLPLPKTNSPRFESPQRTPRSNIKFSPYTPKAEMLEEKTRELHLLRAQLDTERYEKGFLEVQLKQNDEKISKLVEEQKKHLTVISELKNNLLVNNTDFSSPYKSNEDDQEKKRLRKNIVQKEEEVINLNEKLTSLQEEKSLLQQKLTYSNEQVFACLDKIKELDSKIDELSSDLEQKELTIKYLTETKVELEQFINETRSSCSSQADNNTSIECLDTSLSRTTNSSGSISSPENLGVSVIDVQLREKELENSSLREEIKEYQLNDSKLSKHIFDIIVTNSEIFDIYNENFITNEEDELPKTFLIFENYLKKLIENYKCTTKEVKDLRNETMSLSNQKSNLVKQINELEGVVENFRKKVETLESTQNRIVFEKDSLQNQLIEFQKNIKKLEDDIRTLEEINSHKTENIEQLGNNLQVADNKQSDLKNLNSELIQKLEIKEEEFKKINEQFVSHKQSYGAYIKQFEQQLLKKEELLQNIIAQFSESKTHISDLKHNLRNLTRTYKTTKYEYKGKIKQLEENLVEQEQLKIEKHELENTNFLLNEKFVKTKLDMENCIDQLKQKLEELLSKNRELESSNKQLTSENVTVNLKNVKLTEEFCLGVENFRKLENELNEEISKMNASKIALEKSVECYKNDLHQMAIEKSEMSKNLESLQETISELKEDHELHINEITGNNEELSKTISAYQERLKELSYEHITLDTTLKETENNLKELTDYHKLKLDELNTLKSTSDETIEILDIELTNLKLKLSDYETDINGINEMRALFKKEKESLLNKLSEKEQKIDEFNEKFQNAFEQNTKLIKNFNTEKEELGAKLIESKNEIQQTKDLMEKKAKDFEALAKYVNDELKKNIESSEKYKFAESSLPDNDDTLDFIDILKNKFNHIFSFLNYLKEMNNEKNAQIKILWGNLNSFKSHLENSQKEILTIRENIKTDSKSMHAQLNNEVARLSQSNDNLNQTSERLSRENSNLLKIITDLKQKLMENSSCTQRALTLEKHNGELLSELNNLRHEVSVLSEKNAIFDNKNKELVKKCENMEAVQIDCDRTLEVLKENLQKSAEDCRVAINELKISDDTKELKIIELLKEKELDLSMIQKLNEEKETLLKQLNDNLEENNNNKEELDRIRSKYCNAIDNFDRLNKENTQLKYDISLKNEKLESKSKELDLTRKEFENLSTLLIQVQHDHRQKNATFMDLKPLTEKLSSDKYYLEKKETDLLRQLELEQGKSFKLSKELEALQGKVDNYEKLVKVQNEEEKMKAEKMCVLELEVEKLRKEFQAIDLKNVERIEIESKANLESLSKLKEDLENKQIEIVLLKQNLSSCEQNLQSEIAKQIESQKQLQRYESDNTKFVETLDGVNKRLEKQSIKLGESQAKVSKLEKEIEANKKCTSVLKSNLESSRNENAKLREELEECKDKTSKFDHTYDVLLTKHTNLEKLSKELQNNLAKSLELEQKLKNTMKSLISEKDCQAVRIERLNLALTEANNTIGTITNENQTLEKDNVDLNLEIGGLNKMIAELKEKLECEVKGITTSLVEMKDLNEKYKEDIDRLKSEKDTIKEDYNTVNDGMAKLSIRYQIVEEESKALQDQIKHFEDIIKTIQKEKNELVDEHSKCSIVLKNLELKEATFEETRLKLTNKIGKLEVDVEHKTKLIDSLNWQIETLKAAVVIIHPDEISDLKMKLEETEHSLQKEMDTSNKLKSDISIYHAKLCKNRQLLEENERKWEEEKQQLLLLSQNADERIKDNRLELEGKLEKMKLKMKTLYNDEVTKLKNKHERDVDSLKTNLELLKKKNLKYEEHVHKLSKQILEYNETIMELKKQNTFMETRLDSHSVSNASSKRFQRPQTIHIASSNLRMEDEEGELFNNTYLADLKEGRVNENGQDSISVQELQYRNSLAPPHLKSTYLAQYQDHQIAEEDIKDGIPISFDDSMSSLLNTGQRKKASGATSYKRPGPPTPSKNAGRLSFGGCIELPREILKDSHDSNVVSSTKRTPAKFKLFSSSKFTSFKDENSPPKRRLSNLFKKK